MKTANYMGAATNIPHCKNCEWSTYYTAFNPVSGEREKQLYCMCEGAYPPKGKCASFIKQEEEVI